jgi:hypothetical protein
MPAVTPHSRPVTAANQIHPLTAFSFIDPFVVADSIRAACFGSAWFVLIGELFYQK